MLPLSGITVIELAQHLAGPGTGMYLADQGANVIKIEPVAGTSRQAGSGRRTPSQLVLNRNKRAMTLDFRKPEGREVLLKLVQDDDVLIHNFRVGVAERRGIGYEELSQLNPRLIYASITAFGSRGAWAEKGGYDRLTQGLSGTMYRRGKDGIPLSAGVWVSDCSVPMLMAYGIMLALWVREKTGRGQKVETSLLQAALAMQTTNLVRVGDEVAEPVDAGDGYGIFRCGDDQYLNVCALQPDQFRRFCQAIGLQEMGDDPRFFDPRSRAAFRVEAYPIIDGMLGTRPIAQWIEILDAADVPCAPILARPEVFDQPQMRANEMIASIDHPSAGRVSMVDVPVRLSTTPGSIRTPAPELGQHTDDVLTGLGYSEEAIEKLREAAVI
jgi:crotonobetainyl-CoA:carnitine CoA-transferase CaiB-like acyl-CoA transferase